MAATIGRPSAERRGLGRRLVERSVGQVRLGKLVLRSVGRAATETVEDGVKLFRFLRGEETPIPESAPVLSDVAERAEPEPRPEASGELGIPDYDTLAASQVVSRLNGLSPEELAAVRDYETSTRARRTILNRIAQLETR